jgi:hypothetical protein
MSRYLVGGIPTVTGIEMSPPVSRDKAAAILLSAPMVAGWDQVESEVAPEFALLNGDAALKQIVPITAEISQRILNAVSSKLLIGNLGPTSDESAQPPVSQSPTAKRNQQQQTSAAARPEESSGANGQTAQQSMQKAPPPAPSNEPGEDRQSQISAELAIDPVLKYKTALALFQSVRLLNKEAAFLAREKCYEPYLLQVTLTVMPYRRNLPYDVHGRIAFFQTPTREERDRHAATSAENASAISLSTAVSSTASLLYGAAPADPCKDPRGAEPRIIPILATDDVERAFTSRAADTARQVGAATSLLARELNIKLQADAESESNESGYASDFNSRLTVGRIAGNVLYIRIGAALTALNQYELVGQTYDVWLVLLVPHGENENFNAAGIDLVSYSELRDARTGIPLPGRSDATLNSQVSAAVESVLSIDWQYRNAWKAIPDELRDEFCHFIANAVAFDNREEFHKSVVSFRRNFEQAAIAKGNNVATVDNMISQINAADERIWTAVSAIVIDSEFKEAHVALPAPIPEQHEVIVHIPPQTALLRDSHDVTEVQLSGVQNADRAWIVPSLKLELAANDVTTGGAQSELIFVPQRVDFDRVSETLSLDFPSLARWRVPSVDFDRSRLEIKGAQCLPDHVCPQFDLPLTQEPYGQFRLIYRVVDDESAPKKITAPESK